MILIGILCLILGWSLAMGYSRVKEGCKKNGRTRRARRQSCRSSKASSGATEEAELSELPPPDSV